MALKKVYFVGAGPGSKDLLTIKGAELIGKADVIIHDAVVSAEVLALVSSKCKLIKVGSASKEVSSKEGQSGLLRGIKSTGVVVRLVSGSPFIFNNTAEEASFLNKKNIEFEIVPAVIDSVGASSYSDTPLSKQGSEKTITLGRSKGCGLDNDVLKRGDVLAISVFSTGLPTIVKGLLKTGANKNLLVSVIKNPTTSSQVTVSGNLGGIVKKVKEAGLESPFTFLVDGNKKAKGKQLKIPSWFESQPLFGKRVMVTRTLSQSQSFVDILSSKGAKSIICPTIKITPPSSYKEVDRGIKKLASSGGYYDWIIFTSANGVRCFSERLLKLKRDVRDLKGVKVCAIGPKTAKTVKELFGIHVDLTPKEYVAEGILKEFKKPINKGIKGKKFFLPRATVARNILPDEIKRLGGVIDVAPVYKTIRPKKEAELAKKLIKKGEVDVITFTSSSTVTNFVAGYKKGELEKIIGDTKVACIGPVTRDTAIRAGMKVDVMATNYTVDGLVEALDKFFK